MKVKGKVSSSWNCGRHVGLPLVFILCSLLFAAGLFASLFLLSQDASRSLPEVRDRTLLVEEEDESFASMAHGRTGDPSVNSIPFQVFSWRPRALLFPRFAEPEQCQTIIKIAKNNLAPSTLMLRKGETAENTKGIRTSSGTFISAAEDKNRNFGPHRTEDCKSDHDSKITWVSISCGVKEVRSTIHIMMCSILRNMVHKRVKGSMQDDNVDVGYDYKRCIGLKVKPKQGDALLFNSLFPNGTIDVSSLHGSCPVIKGEKMGGNKMDQRSDRQLDSLFSSIVVFSCQINSLMAVEEIMVML